MRRGSRGYASAEALDEAEPRAAARRARADLELVGERRMIAIPSPPSDSSSARRPRASRRRLEALALVGDLDHEPVGVELVEDLDDAARRPRTRGGPSSMQASVSASFRSASISSRAARPQAREPGQGKAARA